MVETAGRRARSVMASRALCWPTMRFIADPSAKRVLLPGTPARSSERKSGFTRPGKDPSTANDKSVCVPLPNTTAGGGHFEESGHRTLRFRDHAVSFALVGDRLMVGPRTLTPLVGVRIPLPQPDHPGFSARSSGQGPPTIRSRRTGAYGFRGCNFRANHLYWLRNS